LFSVYTGPNVIGFMDDMQALPISALWEITSGESPQLADVGG
jgi:hypothetical protein